MADLDRRPVWIGLTTIGALLATAFDAVLLQQKKAFFTGGFLTEFYTRTTAEAVWFLAASLILDAALLSFLVVLARRLVVALRLTPAARAITVMGLASMPIVVMTFVSYRLLSYLGGTFDLSLMFDLTGRKPQEILAVAAAQLARAGLLGLIVGGAAAAIVWKVNRLGPVEQRLPGRKPHRLWLTLLATLLVGSLTTIAATRASEAAEDGLPRKASGRVFGTIVRYLSDIDRDGYGAFGRLRDSAPLDAAIHPYAIERPGDGIDQNGVAGDLPADGAAYTEPEANQNWRKRPDVLLVVLESFRADTVGRVVSGVPVTPTLDVLAREGVSSPLAFSHNGYTAQSRFHLFSGSLAGLRQGRTLIDDFKANGYEVGYFSGQDESFGGAAYAVGFDRADVAYDARKDRGRRYSTFVTAGSLAVPAAVVVERVTQFLDSRSGDRPLFLYVNFHDTHYPYHHAGIKPLLNAPVLGEGSIAPANQDALHQMYLNTAANVDRAIGETLAAVERRLGHRPAVIVTADHGESLFDEGFLGHGYALNEIQTRVPLIVRGLPLIIEQPFGQNELRDAIGAALAQRGPAEPPRTTMREGKSVFQYLGNVDRPRQVARRFADGTLVYDFRSTHVHADGRWLSASEIPSGAADRVSALVHLWERMLIARSANEQ